MARREVVIWPDDGSSNREITLKFGPQEYLDLTISQTTSRPDGKVVEEIDIHFSQGDLEALYGHLSEFVTDPRPLREQCLRQALEYCQTLKVPVSPEKVTEVAREFYNYVARIKE